MTADATLRIRGDTADAASKVRALDAQTDSLGSTFGRAGGGADRFTGSIKSGQASVEKMATAVTGASSVLGGMGSQAGATAGAISNLLSAAIAGPLVAAFAVATTVGAVAFDQWQEGEKQARALDQAVKDFSDNLETRLGRELQSSIGKVQDFRDELVDLEFDLSFGGSGGSLRQVNAEFTKVQQQQLEADFEIRKARQRVRDEEERLEEARARRRNARNENEAEQAFKDVQRAKTMLDGGGELGGLRQRLRAAERELEVLEQREQIIVERQAPAAQRIFDAQEEKRRLAEAERKSADAERKKEREAERAAEKARRARLKAAQAEAKSEEKNAEIRRALAKARQQRAFERDSSTPEGELSSSISIGSTIESDLRLRRELEGTREVSKQEFELNLRNSDEAKRLETDKVNHIIAEVERQERFRIAIGNEAATANINGLMGELAAFDDVEQAKTYIRERELDRRQRAEEQHIEFVQRLAQDAINFTANVANQAFVQTLDVIEQVSAGQQVEFGKIAAAFVRNVGTQIVGIGIRYAAEGAGELAASLVPGNQAKIPGALALISTGAAIGAVGAGMAVTGAVAAGAASRFSSGGGGGGGSSATSGPRQPSERFVGNSAFAQARVTDDRFSVHISNSVVYGEPTDAAKQLQRNLSRATKRLLLA